METFLNLLWLLLALTSAALWIAYWRQALFARGRRRQVFYSAVGLICVLVLMFFAISLTDDLYEITALVEDAALVSARASKLSAQHHRVVHSQPDLGTVTSSFFAVVPPAFLGNVLTSDAVIVLPNTRSFLDLRAPPAAIL
jgi:UDP-N-acetylmuramyl pentapeptide phosphotransferase/UDP-N-acetylglucosamine-1-phosphate transferase